MRKSGLRPNFKSHYTVKLFEEGKRSLKNQYYLELKKLH